ncbi:MAG: SAM-dependent methyltransferase, partial [Lachnospiraceae bacterium]|nr:SAM-dependent methyltransferase [Lachnospiraceae bacterium]
VGLSRRLMAIAGLVSEKGRLCDVGCDHAYLSVSLVEQGRIPSAIAMDVAQGPLAMAARHVAERGLSDRVELRLSDGLEKLQQGEAYTLVLAGMGGRLILDILSREPEVASSVPEWILAPQSDQRLVRRWLRSIGRQIVEEELVREKGKYYPIMKAVPSAKGQRAGASEALEPEDSYGPVLLRRRHPLLLAYLRREQDRLEAIRPEVETRQDESSRRILQELSRTRQALQYFEDGGETQ